MEKLIVNTALHHSKTPRNIDIHHARREVDYFAPLAGAFDLCTRAHH